MILAMLVVSACAGNAPHATPVPPARLTQEPVVEAAAVPIETAVAEAPADESPSPLDDLLNQWMTPGNGLCDAPGAVLLVDSPTGRYLKAAGVTSLEDPRPVQVDDRFEIGSNTKAFTVILALQLQDEGVLSMDDPLSKWLPELAAQIPNGDQVTLRQMAGNTSGIWDYADPLMQPIVDANDQEGLAQSYTPQELVDYAIANGSPDFAPGEGWHYSSTNFILLGMVVEAATGKSLAELYQERIFDPLEMTSTSYLEGSPEPGSIVDGYYAISGDELTNMTNWNATQGGAAGAIVSTAEDMSRFIGGLVGGELLQGTSLDAMFDFRELDISEGGGVFAGYGLGIIDFQTNGFSALGHAGQTAGFQSVWFFVPESATAFVLLTNSGSCHVIYLPSTLAPETLGVTAGSGGFAQSCANVDLPYPRPEPEYNTKVVRDLSLFADALAGLAVERIAELDALLAGATVLPIPWLQIGGVVLLAYLFALLTTVIPAYQAARIYPAEALRYE